MTPRERVIAEAEGWLSTHYHHRAMVKGAGVDCAMLLVAAYRDAGIVGEVDVPNYPPDWHLHREEEKYLQVLLRHCHEVERPKPGDIALFRFGRAFSHGAIVVEWPRLIHAYLRVGCEIVTDVERDGRFVGRARRFFSPFEEGE